MNLKAIAFHLEANGLGTIGTSIFTGEMPAACEKGILLMPAYHGTVINYNLPKYRDTGFRMITRSKVYEQADDLAQRASALLTVQGAPVELAATAATSDAPAMPGMHITQCLPIIEPKPYRRGAGALWEFETELDINYVVV